MTLFTNLLLAVSVIALALIIVRSVVTNRSTLRLRVIRGLSLDVVAQRQGLKRKRYWFWFRETDAALRSKLIGSMKGTSR